MLKHAKNKTKTHRFGTLKRPDNIIKDFMNCKKCCELNEKHKCKDVVENNVEVIYTDAE